MFNSAVVMTMVYMGEELENEPSYCIGGAAPL